MKLQNLGSLRAPDSEPCGIVFSITRGLFGSGDAGAVVLLLELSSVTNAGKIISESSSLSLSRSSFVGAVKILADGAVVVVGVVISRRGVVVVVVGLAVVVLLVVVLAMNAGMIGAWA